MAEHALRIVGKRPFYFSRRIAPLREHQLQRMFEPRDWLHGTPPYWLLLAWPYVLIHPEQIVRVIAPLDFGQPAIIRAVSCLDAFTLVVGHEIDVGAA